MLDSDIKFFEPDSRRPDSTNGGQITNHVITSGQIGNLVAPIADADKVTGNVAGYKFYVSAYTADTEVYYKPWIFISKPPADPEVGVVLFYTGNWYDRWAEAVQQLEKYTVISSVWFGNLNGLQVAGQKSVQLYQRPGQEYPSVGDIYGITKQFGTNAAHSQLVRATEVSVVQRVVTINDRPQTFDFITINIAEVLDADYDGGAFTINTNPAGVADFRTTRVADAVKLYGIKALLEQVEPTERSVLVDSIYHQLVPAATQSINLPNMDIGGRASGLVASGSGNTVFIDNTPLGPGKIIYLGSPFMPGTLSVAVDSSSLTDNGRGYLLSGTTPVAQLDYVQGLVTGLDGAPTYIGSKTYTFQTAGAPAQTVHSTSIGVDVSTRRNSYVITLGWIPSKGSLKITYIAGGKVYKIWDSGNGVLAGLDSSHGVGQFNWFTNTLTFTLVYLADLNTEIIIASGVDVVYSNQAGTALNAPEFRFQLQHAGGVPGSFVVSWNDGSDKQLTDNKGLLSGTGGAGYVRYLADTGPYVVVRATSLPAPGTVFTIAFEFGAPLVYVVSNPSIDGDGFVTIQLPDTNIHAGSVEVLYKAGDSQYIVLDDGVGHFYNRPTSEFINHSTGQLKIKPNQLVYRPQASFSLMSSGLLTHDQRVSLGYGTVSNSNDASAMTTTRAEYTSTLTLDVLDGNITIRYRANGSGSAITEYHTADTLYMDVTPNLNQPLVPNTTAFRVAGRDYWDRAGGLVSQLDRATGAGVDSGDIDQASGLATMTVWNTGAPAPSLWACLTELGRVMASNFVFQSPTRPLSPGAQILATLTDGTEINITVPSSGIINTAHLSGTVNVQTGMFHLRFGYWKTIVSGDESQWWYSTDNIRAVDGKIFREELAYADSLRINATATSILPVDKEQIGINPSAFSADGLVQIFNKGDNVVIQHEDETTLTSPIAPASVHSAGRNRLYRVRVVDANGLDIPSSASTWTEYKDDTNGLQGVQFAPSGTLNLSAYVQPFVLHHQILDRNRVSDVDISGAIALEKPLSHTFPVGSYISTALALGNMLVSIPLYFTQATWTSVWSDSRIGSEPLMQYQAATHPIELTNDGAVTDRWAFVLATSTTYNCYSEGLGKVNQSPVSIYEDYSPVNPLTGKPYFIARAGVLGAGGNQGETFRFNTESANRPIWPIVTVLPGNSLVSSDQFQVQVIGNAE